jgi:outer membrane protein assembly factor BamB
MAVTLDEPPVLRSVLYVWNSSGDGTDPTVLNGRLLTVNAGTGEATPVNAGAPPQEGLSALAVSPSGAIYGATGSRFYAVDPETGTLTFIGATGSGGLIRAMDFSCDGTLYGVNVDIFGPDRLLTINPSTGAISESRLLSQDVGNIESIAFSRMGTLIGSGSGTPLDGPFLFDLDAATGQVSNLRPVSGTNVGRPMGMGFVRTCPRPN